MANIHHGGACQSCGGSTPFASAGECVSQTACHAAGKVTHEDACVTPQSKCERAGWQNSSDDAECIHNTANVYNGSADAGDLAVFTRCAYATTCGDYFGRNMDFPPEPGLYVYNCDPDPASAPTGLVPANFVAAETVECSCSDSSGAPRFGGRVLSEIGGVDISQLRGGRADITEVTVGGRCLDRSVDVVNGGVSDANWCHLFGGDPEGRICSGMDAADTFCVLDSDGAFALACRGLFRHMQRCNEQLGRVAENVFLCGGRCDTANGQVALGGMCACRDGALVAPGVACR